MNTYIKLFRNVLDWEWYKDANTFRVFMHILLKANYEPSKFRGETIEAGECVFGYRQCAEDLGLTVRQIRTAIKHLKSTHEVTTKVTSKFTIVRVEKWGFWQDLDGQVTSEVTSKRSIRCQASDKQVTQSKEIKNIRNKEIYKGLPEDLQKSLKDFEEMRKRIHKPMTDRARTLILNKLEDLAGANTNLKIAILEQSIMNSWQSVYPLKTETANSNGSNPFLEMLQNGDY